MKKLLISIFSDGSNIDVDFAKVATAIGIGVFMVLSMYAYGYKGSAWNPMEWTTALGILIGTGAGVSKIQDKSGTPPKDQ